MPAIDVYAPLIRRLLTERMTLMPYFLTNTMSLRFFVKSNSDGC